MSTNYYLILKPNLIERLAGHEDQFLHIGKSSGGWCFALHVHKNRGLMSLRDWYLLWRRNSNQILDEYDREITIEEMIDVITNRRFNTKRAIQAGGYTSNLDFYEKNHAAPGPNGLCRHRIDGTHCVAHGPGTWDLLISDFS